MKITALAGGVGAAKFLAGLVQVIPQEDLTVIVNTGDDFEWMGLRVCPDLDTITYTLAGIANRATGWGLEGDTFAALDRLRELGCDPWFRIGDRDLATHVYRTARRREGKTPAEVTRELQLRNGIRARILPMTDSEVPTKIQTEEGLLEFQDYFVRRRCEPRVKGIVFEGAGNAVPAPGVLEAIASAEAVVVCPSNPLISIGPILSVPGIRAALSAGAGTVAAISPIVAGRAIKGPTATMFAQLGLEVSAAGVASLYRDFLDCLVVDETDLDLVPRIQALGIRASTARTIMDSPESASALAWKVTKILASISQGESNGTDTGEVSRPRE
jgi:LPPG:FO 2-phospho-L-lactate transferase